MSFFNVILLAMTGRLFKARTTAIFLLGLFVPVQLVFSQTISQAEANVDPIGKDSSDDAPSSSPEDVSPLARVQHPFGIFVSAGTPAPSYIGGSVSYQFNSTVEFVASTGVFWLGDLSTKTNELAARFQILQTNFTPMLGAGFSQVLFRGTGAIQNLDANGDVFTFLGSLMVGLDWALHCGLRLSAGINFHYPVKLNFPFVDVGWIF